MPHRRCVGRCSRRRTRACSLMRRATCCHDCLSWRRLPLDWICASVQTRARCRHTLWAYSVCLGLRKWSCRRPMWVLDMRAGRNGVGGEEFNKLSLANKLQFPIRMTVKATKFRRLIDLNILIFPYLICASVPSISSEV